MQIRKKINQFIKSQLALHGDSGFTVPELYAFLMWDHGHLLCDPAESHPRLTQKAQELIATRQRKTDNAGRDRGRVLRWIFLSGEVLVPCPSRRCQTGMYGRGTAFPTDLHRHRHESSGQSCHQILSKPENDGKPDQERTLDRLSSTRFNVNAAKLPVRVLANNLQAGFRLLCLPKSWKKKGHDPSPVDEV